jgi:hypothetical protein
MAVLTTFQLPLMEGTEVGTEMATLPIGVEKTPSIESIMEG